MEWRYVEPFGIRMPLHYSIHGIDVSHHNSRINWQRVRQMEAEGIGLRFVFVKATEGATLVDRQFKVNWKEARRAGLQRGAYHFFHPRRDADKQARNFIRNVQLEPGDFAPVLDFELDRGVPREKLLADLRHWLEVVEDHYGVRPIIYTNSHFYKAYIRDNFDDYPLWLADYSRQHLADFRTDRLFFWQHNASGWVDGIRGQVDFNVFVPDSTRIREVCL